jgi:hypothetical protein
MRTLSSFVLAFTFGLSASLVTACAERSAEARYIKGPDNDQWFEITCTDEVHNCRTKAAELCPNGYVTEDRESHPRAGHLEASMMIKCR